MGTALALAHYSNGVAVGPSVTMGGTGGPEDLSRALYELQRQSHNVLRPTLTPGKLTGTALTLTLYSNGVPVSGPTSTLPGHGGMEDLNRTMGDLHRQANIVLRPGLTPGH
jgi:hypothetical protein